jgi:hypothetical protein
MRANPIFDDAVVDALQPILEGATDVHVLGALADGARERLARALTGTPGPAAGESSSQARHSTVVVLDVGRLAEGEAAVQPHGTLVVAAANPRYAPLLVEVLEGSRDPCTESVGLDGLCQRLEADGWEVEDTTPVIVPLALVPFDPVRVPKTMLAYLYAREPEIEAYCFLVRARQPVGRPPLTRQSARAAPAEFPTTPWRSEAEWREDLERLLAEPAEDIGRRTVEIARMKSALEDARRELEALQLTRRLCEEELARIKASPAWRAIVSYRTARERVLPPETGRGRLYERVRLAVHRIVDRGR